MAFAASSVTEMMRVQRTSRVMASKVTATACTPHPALSPDGGEGSVEPFFIPFLQWEEGSFGPSFIPLSPVGGGIIWPVLHPSPLWGEGRVRGQCHDEIAAWGHDRAAGGADDQRRAFFLDDGGTGELVVDTELVAIVDRGRYEAIRFMEIGGTRSLERAAGAAARSALQHHLAAGDGRAHRHADIQELDGHAGGRESEFLAIGRLEGGDQLPSALRRVYVRPLGQRHHEVKALTEEAAIDQSLYGRVLELEPCVRHHRPRFVLELPEGRFEIRHS